MSGYVTVAEAAASLSVSPARIHQLITEGALVATPRPPGRLRRSPGVAFIDGASVDEERLRRQAHTSASTRTSKRDSRNALYEMKIRLDQARDDLKAERARSRQLAAVLTQMAQLVESSIDQSDAVDDIAEGYSAALSEVLGPSDPGALTADD